jgi:zinc metalloprotease ZmpB
LRRMLLTAGLALIASAVVVAVAVAAKPGNGQSTGTATVFLPNPVADLQDQSLTDQKDADYAALAPAYHRVTLTNLDGSGFLRGDWANITSETGNPAYSPTNDFNYHRNDDRFEQVMAYYWVTEAQKYIQGLGFGSTRRPVNMESQDLRINQWGQDNSFSWDKKDMVKLGKGGVDDAEDAEVILHELGHAIQDSQQTPFGFGFSVEARSIGEGFADYWAATVSNLKAPTPDPACIADWDSVSYDPTAPHCLRRVDTNLHYPENLNGAVHHDGQIWSRALWDIRNALGNVQADTLILEGQFGQRDPSMPQLARSTVAAAQSLYGNAAANTVRAAFVARGILQP